MADADEPPMHDDFAQWCSVISLGDDRARREARWKGVSSVVKNADRNTVETLLRLAHKSRQAPSATSEQTIREAFKSADDAFEMSGNTRELQVLAGACLAILMERDSRVGAGAALAATTAGLGGARKPDLPMDLTALGEAAILHWGNTNRKRPSLTNPTLNELPKLMTESFLSKNREQFNAENVNAAFLHLASATRTSMELFAKDISTTVSSIDRFLRMQDEELQMLWWLTGQHSWDYDRAFDDVAADARPLVFASELASSTQFPPGPPSIKAILSRAGLKERGKISIPAAVNAADTKWLQSLLGGDHSPVSTPLHEAIKRQLETGTGEAWIAGWAAVTDIDAARTLSGLALGNFFYRERLLMRFR